MNNAGISIVGTSDEARYITGQTIVANGGWNAYTYLQSWLDEVGNKQESTKEWIHTLSSQ